MGFSTGPAGARSPFRIVVLGDFSGSGESSAVLHGVDGSSFDATLAKVGGTLRLPGPAALSLKFENLKALRPEGIARQLPGGAARLAARGVLVQLKSRRIGLDEAMAAIRSAGLEPGLESLLLTALKSSSAPPVSRPADTTGTPVPDAPPVRPAADADDPLGGLLSMVDVPGQSGTSPEESPARPTPPPDPASSAISSVIGALAGSKSGSGPAPTSGLTAALRILDADLGSDIQTVLDDPDFRRFEAAWRGLRFLISRVDFREGITLEIVPTRAGEVDTVLRKIAFDQAAGALASPISLLIGAHTPRIDVEGLDRFSEAARAAETIGAPFVTGADFAAAGELAATPEWAEFRAQPSSRWLGVAINRFLLRLPFGADTDPVKDFPFEEEGSQFTWASPALAVAAVAARSQAQHGWPTLFEGRDGAIEDLPVRPSEGGQIPTEHLVGPDQARGFVEKGFIALAAAPERDQAFIVAAPSAVRGRSIPWTLAERRLVAIVEGVLGQSVGASPEELERAIRKQLGAVDFKLQIVPATGRGDGAQLVMRCRPGPPILPSPEDMELQFLL